MKLKMGKNREVGNRMDNCFDFTFKNMFLIFSIKNIFWG